MPDYGFVHTKVHMMCTSDADLEARCSAQGFTWVFNLSTVVSWPWFSESMYDVNSSPSRTEKDVNAQ